MPEPITDAGIDAAIASAEARFNQLIDTYPNVYVNSSGGKDSAVITEIAARVAVRRGITLPVNFVDHEALDPDTEAYLTGLRNRPGLDLRWYCCAHTMQLADDQAFWIPWDKACEADWIRRPPEGAICDPSPVFPLVRGLSHFGDSISGIDGFARSALCMGNRAAENIARRAIMKGGRKWKTEPNIKGRWYAAAWPIGDWSTRMVWATIARERWPFSRFYYRMFQAGVGPARSRLGPIIGRDSSETIQYFRRAYPAMWQRIVRRVPSSMTVVRLASTVLGGRGGVSTGHIPVLGSIAEAARSHDDEGVKSSALKSVRMAVKHAYFSHVRPPKRSDLLKMALRGEVSDNNRQRLRFTHQNMVRQVAGGRYIAGYGGKDYGPRMADLINKQKGRKRK